MKNFPKVVESAKLALSAGAHVTVVTVKSDENDIFNSQYVNLRVYSLNLEGDSLKVSISNKGKVISLPIKDINSIKVEFGFTLFY